MNGPFEFAFKDDPRTGREKGILEIRNCKTIYRNFAGAPTKFTDAGRRQFSILITPELGDILTADGWNVKTYKNRATGGEEEEPYIQVNVNYRDAKDELKASLDPVVHVIKNGKMEDLTEETVGMLDWATIDNVDVRLSPYHWNFNGNTGVKGYLKEIWVTLAVDELERLYVDCGSSCDGDCDNCVANEMAFPLNED